MSETLEEFEPLRPLGITAPQAWSEITALRAAVATLTSERDALQRFKDWVHARLDAAGVPANPSGPHTKEGCRIGDRMDIALAAGDRGGAIA